MDDMDEDLYRGSNPYDAHGPYDDDYRVPGPSRPPPIPYDDPYAEVPTSDACVRPVQMDSGFGGEPDRGSRRDSLAFRGRISGRGTRGRGARSHRLWSTSRRGYHHHPVTSERTLDSDTDQSFPVVSPMVESAAGYGQATDAIAPDSLVQSTSNAWQTNNIHGYGQSFVQPHINPRFAASVFGLNLPSGPMFPWASQNLHDHMFPPHHWADTWTMHGSAGSEGEGDTYRPM